MIKRINLIIFLILICIILTINNFKNNYYTNFSKIPILFDGKIRPLNSFSKSLVNELNLNNKSYSHVELLAKLLFDFDNFAKMELFKIKNKDIINNLDLNYNKSNHYCINEITQSIKKNYNMVASLQKIDYDNRTNEQNDIIKIYHEITYILKIKNYFNNNLDKNTDEKDHAPFYFIALSEKLWLSNKNSDLYTVYDIINKMKENYKNNKEEWSKNCNTLYKNSINKITSYDKIKINIEYIYNKINFIQISLIFYIISLATGLIGIILKYKLSIIPTLILAVFFHISEIILRVFLSERAPVTNLYESIVFVNLITTIFFFTLYYKKKINYLFIFFITTFQYIAYKYSIDGTNIKNLMPVLDTNFWLILHVITITCGYALCLISGLLAHLYLYFKLDINNKKEFLKKFLNLIHFFVILSLLFSLCGTILGGVWADQSWGRFWGWDPKENGAMLIILWLTFIIHARMSKFSNENFYINGIIINNIMVFLAWFGVNLLNVGLHSYGFTKNVGLGLIMFLIFELSYIMIFQFILNKKKRSDKLQLKV